MKKLKARTRADTQQVEPRRSPRRNWDRFVYLGLLAMFFVAIGNYVAGDILFLRADGLVMRDRSEIGASSLVRISEVSVRPGQVVAKGDTLLRAESISTLGRLADLSIRQAELVERGVRLKSELALAQALLPRAQRRATDLRKRQVKVATLNSQHLVTSRRMQELEDQRHAADVEAATLKAQVEGLGEEIAALDISRQNATNAVRILKTRYQDGAHIAATAGVIGERVPAPGEVLNPGELILTLYWGEPFVLAFLPKRYLFGISVGERVVVSTGQQERSGVITAILPMSQSIPDEFRNAFKAKETRQLARIALDAGPELPALASVQISREWSFDHLQAPLAQAKSNLLNFVTSVFNPSTIHSPS